MYVKTTYRYGGMIEVRKHHSSRYGDHRKRRGKTEPTADSVKRANERRRREHFFRILAANFDEGDAHATLTYREDAPDEKKEVKKFLRSLRAEMKKQGRELKYIYVTEYTKKGKPHHHMVLNVQDIALIRKCWKAGGVHVTPLYPDKDYEQLADYLLKGEGERKKRYSASRNLTIPKPETEIIQASTWKEVPEPPKGYWIPKDSIHQGINADGYPYQRYMLVPIQVEERNRRHRKKLEKEAERYLTGRWWKNL